MAETIERILGPVFVGLILNWALFGGLTIQLYNYYDAQQTADQMYIKIMVYGLYIIDIVSSVFITSLSWGSLVKGWGNPAALSEVPWMGTVIPCFNGFTSMVVQVFFAWRIWTLRKNKITAVICGLIVATALMQCAAAFAVSIQVFTQKLGALLLVPIKHTIEVWLIGAFVCDLVITMTMTIILADIRRKAPFKRTETLMNRLIVNTIETGAITSVVAILDLAMYLRWPEGALHVTPEYVLGRLYTNVLLAALNGRRRGPTADTGSLESNTLQFHSFRSQLRLSSSKQEHVSSSFPQIQGSTLHDSSTDIRLGSVDLRGSTKAKFSSVS